MKKFDGDVGQSQGQVESDLCWKTSDLCWKIVFQQMLLWPLSLVRGGHRHSVLFLWRMKLIFLLELFLSGLIWWPLSMQRVKPLGFSLLFYYDSILFLYCHNILIPIKSLSSYH